MKYQNSVAKGKFCGLAQNSVASAKQWALFITIQCSSGAAKVAKLLRNFLKILLRSPQVLPELVTKFMCFS